MTMTKTSLNLIISVLSLAYLSACGSAMNDQIQAMDSSEKKFNEAQSQRVVAFMSLEVMFPDASVRALAKAAGEGNIQKVEQLVKEGVSVNSKGTQGVTPLYWALRNYNGFKRLLELGADPNVVFGNGGGGSVLHAAVGAKDDRLLKAVLQHGGNPNLIDNQLGYPPLFSALPVGVRAVETVLDAGANIDAQDRFGNTAAIAAAGRGRFEIVFKLLERGADYTLKDRTGRNLADEIASVAGALRPGSDSAKWAAKVIEWLRAKGVEIPASPQRRQ
jgi:ankyrin repeat protein